MILYSKSVNGIEEWGIIELQGDLEVRGNELMDNQYIGDLNYDKYGQPILIIGHHILHGKEQKMEKPFAVLEKSVRHECDVETEQDNETTSAGDANRTQNLDVTCNRTVLDSTIAIEHKSKPTTEYQVRAIVRKKLVFKARPKPIIANVPKQV